MTLLDFLGRHGMERALDKHPRLGLLRAEVAEWYDSGRHEEVLEEVRMRMRGLLLDEAFAEAGCVRALEKHPRLKLLPVDLLWNMMQKEEGAVVMEWAKERHEELRREDGDPYRYGWLGDPSGGRELGGGWKRAMTAIEAIRKGNPLTVPKVLLMGGNRSGKSTFAGWYAMKLMVEKPGANVAVLCPSQAQARQVMMERMFRYLPTEWKPEETGKANSGYKGRISYNLKSGFTDDKFSLPNGSQCQFYFYLDGDPKSIEGPEFDLVVADEEVPVEWLETAQFRLVSRQGVMLAMFTPISGYGPTVAWFKGGVKRVLEEREAEMLPMPPGGEGKEGVRYGPNGCELLPLMEMGADAGKRIVYFWTEENLYPMNGYAALKNQLVENGASREKILVRAYGVPTKVKDSAFPRFDIGVHGMRLGEVPKEVTWWHVLDPANGRNPVMQWWGCDEMGQKICVREWPQQDDSIPGVGQPGPWATVSVKQGRLDGAKGEAQESWGLSYKQQAQEIERIEMELARMVEGRLETGARIHVFRRILDSRLGSTTMHGTTIQKEFSKVGVHFDFAAGKHLNITTADSEATAGITLINDALSWEAKRPLGPDNFPSLRVVYEEAKGERDLPKGCANTVFSLQTWTGADGEKGACKDFVDTTHYFLRDEPRYVPRIRIRPGGKWGGYGS